MNCKNEIFYKIISVDWEEALLCYELPAIGHVKVELSDLNGNVHIWKSLEENTCGRLTLNNLKANNSYQGTFSFKRKKLALKLKTMEAPVGKMLASFALIADPHLSVKTENRKGRLLVESEMILQDVINQCNRLNLDFVLFPGDITNHAETAEFKIAAGIINQLSAPYFTVPGNHDVHYDANSESYQLWKKFFGTRDGVYSSLCGTLLALDTACGRLSDTSATLLAEVIKKNTQSPLLIMTHFQLFDNSKVCRGKAQKKINNATEHKTLLENLLKKTAIIYVGHQNIPAVKTFTNTVQINLPQPPQYPCGFIYVRRYKNGFFHTFKPIGSEVMRQWSRRAGELAAYQHNETEWESNYRDGKNISESNFIIKK